METLTRFIVIDDDEINNFYCTLIIAEAAGETDIQMFENPETAFEYIRNEYSNSNYTTVLFLDINMPTWSGWEFLEKFEKLDEHIQKQIKIYIVSSSVDPADHQRSRDNRCVMGYFEKPLSEEDVLSTLKPGLLPHYQASVK